MGFPNDFASLLQKKTSWQNDIAEIIGFIREIHSGGWKIGSWFLTHSCKQGIYGGWFFMIIIN